MSTFECGKMKHTVIRTRLKCMTLASIRLGKRLSNRVTIKGTVAQTICHLKYNFKMEDVHNSNCLRTILNLKQLLANSRFLKMTYRT